MRFLPALCILAIAAPLAPTASAGLINYTAAFRSLAATSGGPSASDSTSALASWNHEAHSFNSNFDNWNPANTTFFAGAGYATQDTNLDPGSLNGRLDAHAWDGNMGFGGSATSDLTVSFSLAAAADYTLTGSWAAFQTELSTPLAARITLTSAANTPIFSGGYDPGAPDASSGTLGLSGHLAAGDYTFTIHVADGVNYLESNVGEKSAFLAFNFTVTPAPGSAVILALSAAPIRRRARAALA